MRLKKIVNHTIVEIIVNIAIFINMAEIAITLIFPENEKLEKICHDIETVLMYFFLSE